MKKEEKEKRRREREANELLLIDKRIAKSNKFVKLLFLSIIIVTVIYIVDEIASNVDAKMRTFVIYDLFISSIIIKMKKIVILFYQTLLIYYLSKLNLKLLFKIEIEITLFNQI